MSLKKIRGNWTNGGVVGIKKNYCRWTVFKSNFLKKLTNPAKTWLGTWEVLLNPSVCWRGIRSLSSSRRPPFHCLKKGNGEKAEVCQIGLKISGNRSYRLTNPNLKFLVQIITTYVYMCSSKLLHLFHIFRKYKEISCNMCCNFTRLFHLFIFIQSPKDVYFFIL